MEDFDTAAPAAVVTEAPAQDDPNVAIEELRQQLAQAKSERETLVRMNQEIDSRRQTAERNAATATQRATESTQTAADREFALIEGQLHSNKEQLTLMKGQYRQAMADGDFDKVAEYSEQIGRLSARVENLEGSHAYMEQERKKPAPTPQRQANDPNDWQRAWSGGEFEDKLRMFTPETASWLRQHPQFASDVNFRRQVQGADQLARGRGLIPDTPQFFQYIDRVIGAEDYGNHGSERRQTQHQEPAPAAPRAAATQSAVAAPVSRTVPGSSANSRQVSLTPEEREMARLTLTPDIIGKDKDPEVVFAERKATALQEGTWGNYGSMR